MSFHCLRKRKRKRKEKNIKLRKINKIKEKYSSSSILQHYKSLNNF